MLKKNALNADSVRNAPAIAHQRGPATTVHIRTAMTSMPWPSAAPGFSPTMRTARPTGVRLRTYASSGHADEREQRQRRLRWTGAARRASVIGANGSIVGGVVTCGSVTRYAYDARLVPNSVTPSPETCCDKPSGTVRTRVQQAERRAGERGDAHADPQRRALVDGEPAGEGADDHDPLDAEVQHARALAEQHAERAEDERRGDAQHRDPEGHARDDVDDVGGHVIRASGPAQGSFHRQRIR